MKTIKNLNKLTFKDIIIHEDDRFIIINKPPFVATLEDRNDPTNILQLARRYNPQTKVCHRLDKETSGILVIAKDDEAYKHIARQLEHREVTKMYHAIVSGRHEIAERELDKPIYSSSNRSRIDFQQGKPSVTLISTLEIYSHHTLLACMPFTGRLHQIRVHLADQGMPICGDELYGGSPILLSQIKRNYHLGKDQDERPLMQRVSLHAAGISFEDFSGESVTFKAPYPKDMQATITQLSKNKI